MTDKHPVDTSLGFTVVTTTRSFHLYGEYYKEKAVFLYAFSCINTIPIRPSLRSCEYSYIKNAIGEDAPLPQLLINSSEIKETHEEIKEPSANPIGREGPIKDLNKSSKVKPTLITAVIPEPPKKGKAHIKVNRARKYANNTKRQKG